MTLALVEAGGGRTSVAKPEALGTEGVVGLEGAGRKEAGFCACKAPLVPLPCSDAKTLFVVDVFSVDATFPLLLTDVATDGLSQANSDALPVLDG